MSAERIPTLDLRRLDNDAAAFVASTITASRPP